MDDEHFMQHMETEHAPDMRMSFLREPDQPVRRLREPEVWRTYHKTLHRLWPERHDHDHDWNQMEQHVPQFTERSERIFLNPETGNAFMTPEAAQMHGDCEPQPLTLYRPSLAPIYGGETLLEALWSEMDRLMEALMTGETAADECGRGGAHGDPLKIGDRCAHEDNGDKYRAQELAWVIAVVSNPYAPSVDAIRAEAVRRWNAAEAEADAQEAALNPDEQEEI